MLFPPKHLLPIAIDTSALSNALTSTAAIDRLAEKVLRCNAVLLIPCTTLNEFSLNHDDRAALKHMQRLQRLCVTLGERFCPSLSIVKLMAAECERWLPGPPVYARGWRAFATARRSLMRHAAKSLVDSASWIKGRKSLLFETDRNLPQLLAARGVQMDRAAAVSLISATGFSGARSRVVDEAVDMAQGRVSAAAILADPNRYKAIHLMAHLDWRLCLANAVERPADVQKLSSAERAHETILGLWRTKRPGKGEGMWYDAYITAEAAYSHVFVTDDTDQRRRCDFLMQRSLLTFRTVSLAEFLG